MRPHYAYLPCLTVSEFDTLVTAARSRHRHRGQVISDTSVTMARAVLLEGVRYIDAARDHDGTLSTQAQQAVRVLLRYQAPQTETRLGSADFTQVQPIAPYYSYLPRLTVAEFDALVATAQTRSVRGGKRLSAKSIAMAQVVLLTGAMYSEPRESPTRVRRVSRADCCAAGLKIRKSPRSAMIRLAGWRCR